MESPTGNERRTLPTPPEILALRRGWYALIGGEKGCRRLRDAGHSRWNLLAGLSYAL